MRVRATKFVSITKRSDHWRAHRAEFREIADEIEYERQAADFLNRKLGPTMLENARPTDGDAIRYDSLTENFAVMSADGTIRTFFRPSTSWHGLTSNLECYRRQCGLKP